LNKGSKFDQNVDRFAEKTKEIKDDVKDTAQTKLTKAQEKIGDVKDRLDEAEQGEHTDWHYEEEAHQGVLGTLKEVKDTAFTRFEDAVDYITVNVQSISHDITARLSNLLHLGGADEHPAEPAHKDEDY